MTERMPIEIRGHHLEDLEWLTLNRYTYQRSPEEVAEFHVDSAVQNIRYLFYLGDDPDKAYAHDVLGKTPEDEALFRERMGRVYLEFMTLPEDTLVKLLVDEPDEICRACVVGKHCDQGEGDGDQVLVEDLQRRLEAVGKGMGPEKIVELGSLRQALNEMFIEKYPLMSLSPVDGSEG